MSACTATNVDASLIEENDENAPVNGYDSKCRDDCRDYSGSQDIFSDDDQLRSTTYFSPKVTVVNTTCNSSIVSLKTPVFAKNKEETPGKARIPKTPADLLPFINKPSLLWTSDMETPESKLKEKTVNCDKTENSDTISYTPPQLKTPNCKDLKDKNMDILTSPVLGGKKRSRKCAKRRILNTVTTELDVDQQSSISSNSDKVASDITDSVINEPLVDNKPETSKSTTKECSDFTQNNTNANENKKLEEAAVFDKNSNTSTQEFFINASFSSIDRLCNSVIQEEKISLTNESENKNKEFIKKENKSEDISNDVLERIAAIKRSQKPLRRSSDINHTFIPKEVFSSSARDLEIANLKFNCDKKSTRSQPLKSMSFTKFSMLEKSVEQNKETSSKDEKPNHCQSTIPPEFIGDWNVVHTKVNIIKEEVLNVKPVIKNLTDNYSVSNMLITDGKNITYNNIVKKELPNSNFSGSDIGFSKSNCKDIIISENEASSSRNINQDLSSVKITKLKKAEKLKLFEDLNLKEFLEPNLSIDSLEITDDSFATASGKGIQINEEKENYYSNVYHELGNVDETILNTIKTKKILQLKASKKPMDKAILVFNKYKNCISTETDKNLPVIKNTTETTNQDTMIDGFSTARGRKIEVNDEKENYYSSIYNQLNDIDESSLNSLKTKKKPLMLNKKPTDKAVIVFNETNSNPAAVNKVEVFDVQTTDGFATAGGKKIDVNNDKESYYSSIYNELNDVDENSLSFLKTKKLKLKSSRKPTDKAVIVFNNNRNNSIARPANTSSNVGSRLQVFDTQSSGDGFSTARGKNIAINPEKEEFYSRMYNQLSQEVNNEDSLFLLNKKKLSKLSTNTNQKSVEDVKLTISSDTDDVFCNLDLEKLFQTDYLKTDNDSNNCFTVPNASHILKKTNKFASLPKAKLIKTENIIDMSDSCIRTSSPIVKAESKPMKNQISMLKRKLEACEPKKPERCRSFGGFPIDNLASPRGSKLNKSDPVDEGIVNQPLQKGLSVSQCFDSHSDSWLSKVEISYLNNSKIKSPDMKARKSQFEVGDSATLASHWKCGNFDDLLGFSFKDSTESFRRYLSFEKFLKKQHVKYEKCIDLYFCSGETISISNQAPVKQHLSVQSASNVNMVKGTKESHYILMETTPVKSPENCNTTITVVLEREDKYGEKRKHMDTDSDTPLTTVKKPRIGLEFQGKKLFSDKSDDEESDSKLIEEKNDQQSFRQDVEMRIQVEDEDLTEERCNATLQQEKVIMSKKRIKVKPIVGTLLQERLVNSKNRKSWSDLVGSLVPTARGIDQIKQNHPDVKVLEVTASNATCYKFTSSNIIGNKKVVSLFVGDGANLIFDENGHAGVTEFANAFLAMPGVDPRLLPTGWVENHYRWIVWKLASIDRIRFSSMQLQKALKPKRVMQELKYRYDREIDRAERPALRRILEKDDVPTRRMVLCISSIEEMTTGDEADKEARIKLGLPRWKVEATDGWYSIPLTLDSVMISSIVNGKIKEGTKIITYGAELLECERGFYPLEKPANVSLKIYANSTRRARWDTKLGFQQNSRPIPVKLRSILSNGGLVGQVTVVAARAYPLLYREKTTNGQSIYRNVRSEEKAATAHERACELKVDAMYAEAQKNFDSKKKSDSDEEFELSQMTPNSRTKACTYDHIERKQEQFKQKLECKVREGLPPPRQVTPVLKVRLVDDMSTAMLSIWGANEDSSYDIKEGSTITIYNVFASGVRNGELSLTANRFTHIKTETLLKLPYPIRTCTLIPDIISSLSFEPKFNEFDTVGIVVSCGPAPYGMKNFDVVNFVYPKPNNSGSSFLSILFWDGISSFGYQGLFTPGTIVACSNLEWRRHNAWSVAVAYCSEKSVFTCNPRQSYLSKEIRNLKNLVLNPVSYAESCVDEVQIELSKKLKPRSNQCTPTGSTSDRMSFHNNSSFLGAQESPGGMTIQRRLEKLSQYGNVSDVSPSIVLNNSSTRVKKDYTPVAPRNNT